MLQSFLVPRIASIEIPVSNLQAAIKWYANILGLQPIEPVNGSATEAMLQFTDHPAGVPTVYLVQTDSTDRLQFYNTNYGYTQSIIDFYTPDLAAFHRHLQSQGVKTNRDAVNLRPGEVSGFGFFDPDGNSFGATNAVFKGRNEAALAAAVLAGV